MPENQAVLFWGLNLGVLRILLFQGRAESPMERVAQGKRSGTLGWVIVSKTIYALKGQKRGYCAFVSHTQCYVLIGLSDRVFQTFSKCHVFMFLRFCPFRAWILYFCFTYPGCRFACPGLGASLGFQPAINLSIHGQYPHFPCKKSVDEVNEQILRYVTPKDMLEAPIGEGVDEFCHGRRVFIC